MKHKIISGITIIVSLSVIILVALQIFDVCSKGSNLIVPLMGLMMLCQAYLQWGTNRKVAYISIGTAILVFIGATLVFFSN